MIAFLRRLFCRRKVRIIDNPPEPEFTKQAELLRQDLAGFFAWQGKVFDAMKRKPEPQQAGPRITINQQDMQILMQMHLFFAQGCDTYIVNRPNTPESSYTEAEILVKNYGLQREEVLERTGFYVE